MPQEDQCEDPEELKIVVQPVNAHTSCVYPERSDKPEVRQWLQCEASSVHFLIWRNVKILGNMGGVGMSTLLTTKGKFSFSSNAHVSMRNSSSGWQRQTRIYEIWLYFGKNTDGKR